jgi:hypothetical protein
VDGAAGRDQDVAAGLQDVRSGPGPVGCVRAVFFVLGGLINPDDYGEVAERLSTVFPDFRLEVFPDRHPSISRTGSNPTSWLLCSGN